MTDQKIRKALADLLKAADDLIADMRRRAIMRGDYEVEGDKKIATLDCGNSVLFGIGDASDTARAILSTPSLASEQNDPLLGAAIHLMDFYPNSSSHEAVLQQRLGIGYNRASRLVEAIQEGRGAG